MTRYGKQTGLAFVCAASALSVAPAAAQDLRFVRRVGGYAALGAGGGNYELACAAGCPGELSAAHVNLFLGRHFSPRWRLELSAHNQTNRDANGAYVMMGTAGAAVQLVGGLHLRGAATYVKVDVDSGGQYRGTGGPGFLVGAGYDLHLGRTFALTPYVNYAAGSVTLTGPGGAVDVTTMSFGVNLSFIRGQWECTTAAGERVRVTRRSRVRAVSCLNEVAQRIGRRPSGVKY